MAVVFSLSHCTPHCKSVHWSQDGRIAVTSNEAVYVLSLKGAYFVTKKPLKHDCPVELSLATAPADAGPPPVPYHMPSGVVYNPELRDLGIFVDPLFSAKNKFQTSAQTDPFVYSEWSPSGCSKVSRSHLACTTRSGRLLIYSSSSLCTTQWKQVVNVTDQLMHLLSATEYDVTKISGQYSDHCSSEECEEDSLLSLATAKMTMIIKKHCSQRLLLATCSFSWLPVLCVCPNSVGIKLAVLATASRTGHLLLWGLKVPVTSDTSLVMLEVVKLPVAKGHWVCALKWSCTEEATLLAVGCTSGQVLCLSWSAALTVHCKEEDNSLLLPPHEFKVMWSQEDEIPVDVVQWSHVQQGDKLTWSWLVLNKSSNIVAVPFSWVKTFSHTTQYCVVNSLHSCAVSEIAPLHNGDVISCAMDGSLQKFTLPNTPCWSHDHHVINGHLIPVESLPKATTYSAQGLGVSDNRIFAAVAINPNLSFAEKGRKFRCQLHMFELYNAEQMNKLLEKDFLSSWDVFEYVRLHPTVLEEAKLSTSLAGQRLQRMKEGKLSWGTVQLDYQLILHHVKQLLEEYLRWKKSAETPRDTSSLISLRNCTAFVKSHKNASSKDKQTAGKVLNSLKGMKPTQELCPVCEVTVPFSSFNIEVCSQGHKLRRCCFTLCISTASIFSCHCSLCGATANFSHFPSGTWLSHVFSLFTCCPFCGGFFEQLI